MARATPGPHTQCTNLSPPPFPQCTADLLTLCTYSAPCVVTGAGDLLAPGNPFYYTAGFVENLTPELCVTN